MKKILNQQIKFLNKTIKTNSIHQPISKKKELILCKQLEDNINAIDCLKNENEKKIRVYKERKDKCEGIKIQLLSNISR